jgi:hypothetical protein
MNCASIGREGGIGPEGSRMGNGASKRKEGDVPDARDRWMKWAAGGGNG